MKKQGSDYCDATHSTHCVHRVFFLINVVKGMTRNSHFSAFMAQSYNTYFKNQNIVPQKDTLF